MKDPRAIVSYESPRVFPTSFPFHYIAYHCIITAHYCILTAHHCIITAHYCILTAHCCIITAQYCIITALPLPPQAVRVAASESFPYALSAQFVSSLVCVPCEPQSPVKGGVDS